MIFELIVFINCALICIAMMIVNLIIYKKITKVLKQFKEELENE